MQIRRRLIPVTAAAGLAIVLVACGGGGQGAPGAGGGTPRKGGTLKVIGSADVDHLDPSSTYTTAGYNLARTWTRQLISYPADNDFTRATTPVADVAVDLPTRENGGVSRDGLTYTFTIREGVMWNTNPPRQVTAADFVRGFKRLANPVQPSGGISYYTSTIAGMQEYFTKAQRGGRTAAEISRFMAENEISGLKADGDRKLTIRLRVPASDFLNILALSFASPAPVEYDAYVPDSSEFRTNTVSLGPYQIVRYQAGKSVSLTRNPAWRQDTDPIRHQYVDGIDITLGQDSPDAVQLQLEAGSADLAWDQPVPTSALPRLQGNPDFKVWESSNLNPFLVFNLQSPNNGRALNDVRVRRALSYAVNKAAIVRIFGGPKISTVLNGAIPPGSSGFDAAVKPYATPGDEGDPARCRNELAAAGHPAGLTLQFPYRTNGNHPKVAQSIAGDLTACGVRTTLIATTADDFYGRYLSSVAKSREGKWDIAGPGWIPDWFGNNGRAIVQPLFDGRNYTEGSTNYGAYNNPEVNALIDRALTASSPQAAAETWKQANQKIMADAPIVPLMSQNTPLFKSSRVRGAVYNPLAQYYDFTQIWLG
ncbi:ABC transporter substrate-binding protein [Rhizohabitans arisaemae]|uniref:ABC transporter substrate-binding protein n=1 Tax=Rhizohabitans arisaemae TaxID=2720610 RepID=UPI0024B257E2|nr:ABC transporter substrate-binding protein [Rhizohabitans arisaemae]